MAKAQQHPPLKRSPEIDAILLQALVEADDDLVAADKRLKEAELEVKVRTKLVACLREIVDEVESEEPE